MRSELWKLQLAEDKIFSLATLLLVMELCKSLLKGLKRMLCHCDGAFLRGVTFVVVDDVALGKLEQQSVFGNLRDLCVSVHAFYFHLDK